MRAPILSGYGQTRPSQEGLAYRTDSGVSPEAFGAGIARGLGSLGESLIDASIAYQERQKKTERFGALMGLSEFQVQANEALTNLKRTAPVTGFNFVQEADKLYKTYEQQYLSKLPMSQQQEFQYRSQQIRQGVMGDALDFQYKQQDAFFVEGINTEYERAKNGVFQTPAEYDKWLKHMAEVVASSDLPTAQKLELAREIRNGLTSVLYGKEQELARRPGQITPAGTTPANVEGAYAGLVKRQIPQMQAAVLAGNIEQESGGRPNAWNKDEGALGIIQWRLDRLNKLRAFAAKAGRAPDDIDVQLDFLIWEGTQGGSPQDRAAWQRFMAATTPEEANAALKDYIRYGDSSAGTRLANAKRIMGVDLSTIEVGPSAAEALDSDPRFADIPLEDRLAIQADAQKKVDNEIKDAVAAANAAAEAARNTLFNNLAFGDGGESEIQAAINSGLLDKYEDRNRAYSIVEEKEKKFADQRHVDSIAQNGGRGWNTNDGEKLNNWFTPEMRTAVANQDQTFMNSRLLPTIQALNDMPTDLVGQLEAGARNTNPDTATFALDTLSLIKRISPKAFADRVGEALAGDVAFWEARKSLMPRDQVLQQISGGYLPEERQRRATLVQEAQKILSEETNKIPHAQTLIENIVEGYDMHWATDPQMPALPWAARGVNADFQTLFVDGYVKFGNEPEAIKYAEEGLAKIYGVTTIGGAGQIFMKLPPEKAGYQSALGTYDWIDKQARQELGLGPDDEFQLVTDEATLQEYRTWQGKPSALPPSYLVAVKRDGVWEIEQDERGLPIRKFFVRDAADILQDVRDFESANRIQQIDNEIMELEARRKAARRIFNPVPEGIEPRLEELRKEREGLIKEPPPMELFEGPNTQGFAPIGAIERVEQARGELGAQ